MAIVGTIIPPFVIISIISYCYSAFRTNWVISEMLEGMQAGVAAVIASVTYDMGADIVKQKDESGDIDHDSCICCILHIGDKCRVHSNCLWTCRRLQRSNEKRRERGHKKTEDTSDENTEKRPGKWGME